MPNWDYTQYKIKGGEEEVAALHNTIKDLDQREESLLPNGFGKLWLGNLVHALGGDWNDIYCRGHILVTLWKMESSKSTRRLPGER